MQKDAKNLIEGQDAVAVFHDDSRSGKLDTSVFGIPRKGYGFSNNVNPSMRSARFDEASFMLPVEGTTLKIRMVYR